MACPPPSNIFLGSWGGGGCLKKKCKHKFFINLLHLIFHKDWRHPRGYKNKIKNEILDNFSLPDLGTNLVFSYLTLLISHWAGIRLVRLAVCEY